MARLGRGSAALLPLGEFLSLAQLLQESPELFWLAGNLLHHLAGQLGNGGLRQLFELEPA
jgi:hypothetical protein